jgi:magnesium-protoporphyrin O-methyltransferase
MLDGARNIPVREVPDSVRNATPYDRTRDRVETYFDRTATRTWERLTSDAPVSRIRQTVREGRDTMRDLILSRLPADLSGARVLDAGCGAGQMSIELARRGATVEAVDISPGLLEVAKRRMPRDLQGRVTFRAGDMLATGAGRFDHVVAMDSLIYYAGADIADAMKRLEARVSGAIVFTVAPRTPLLMTMWYAGKLFPRSDRSPNMIPHAHDGLARACKAAGVRRMLRPVDRVTRGFYISSALELRA